MAVRLAWIVVPTYTALALAVVSLWLGGDEHASGLRRHLWLACGALSLVLALIVGVAAWPGLVWIVLLAAAVRAYFASGAAGWLRAFAALVILQLAAGLMLHRLPGFHNIRVIDAVRFTPDAVPFTLYLNYDKTLLGLLLLGWGHARLSRGAEWRAMARTAAPWSLATLGVILVLSVASGYVRWAPKFPPETWLWLGVNLGFTCLAEEALFRGFIQAQLQQAWTGWWVGRWLALAVAAVLFGLAHFPGGWGYVALATVAGAGYGWVYQRTGRIEASILTHFGLNALHFLLFTYPALAR